MGDVDQLGPDDLMSFDACALEGPIFLCFCGFQMVDVECRLADLWHVINSEPRKYIGYPYQGLKKHHSRWQPRAGNQKLPPDRSGTGWPIWYWHSPALAETAATDESQGGKPGESFEFVVEIDWGAPSWKKVDRLDTLGFVWILNQWISL